MIAKRVIKCKIQ